MQCCGVEKGWGWGGGGAGERGAPATLAPCGELAGAVSAPAMTCHAERVPRNEHVATLPAVCLAYHPPMCHSPLPPTCTPAQVQLVRLRVLSSLRQGDVAQRAQHAQSSELHVEFEAAVRLRLRHAASGHLYGGEPGDAAAAASASAAAAAGSPQQQHLHQAAAAGGAGAAAAAAAADGSTSQGAEMDPEEYCRRSRRFVNDDRVRDRVSSQLAGLRRRASMRQEFE